MHKGLHLLSVIAISLLLSRVATQAQDACSSLLQQGIYDHFSMNSGASSYSGFVSSFCSQYNTYQASQNSSTSDDSDSGGFLFISAGSSHSTSLSSSQANALGTALCTDGGNSSSGQANATEVGSFVDPTAMDAYETCLSQYAAGLQVSTTIRPDLGQVTIQITYVAPTGSKPETTLTGIDISPQNSWSCTGPLVQLNASNGTHNIGTDAVAMSCERNISSVPFIYLGQSLYAETSTITIFLTSGTVTRSFTPIIAESETPVQNTTINTTVVMESTVAYSSLSIVQQSVNDLLNNLTAFNEILPGFAATLTNLTKQLTVFSAEPENSDVETWSNELSATGQHYIPPLSSAYEAINPSLVPAIQAVTATISMLNNTINEYYNQTSFD